MAYTVKTPTARNHRKRYFVIATIIVLAVAGAGGLALRAHHNNAVAKKTATGTKAVNSVDYSPAKPGDSTANEDRKGSTSAAPTLNGSPSNTNTTANFSAQIVSVNNNSGNVHIGTSVSGITSGSCTLTATKGSQSVNLGSANVQQDVNSYDCGVFNEATSTFPSSGSWKLTLTVTNGSVATSDSATVTI